MSAAQSTISARAALGGLEVLRLGQEGEPAAEGSLVVGVVQAQEIGRAVGGGIGGVELGHQANCAPAACPESGRAP